MTRFRPSLPVLAIAGFLPVAVLVLSACGNAVGGSAAVTGVTSSTATTEAEPESSDPSLEGANLLTPVPGLVDVRATPWQRVTGTAGELVVHWTSTGLAPCSLLSRVDVAEAASTVTITLYTGQSPGVRCGVAPQVALPLAARVALAADLGSRAVVDGAR
jgi:hypothetical protein